VKNRKFFSSLLLTLVLILSSCGNEAPPMASAVNAKDSVPLMVDYGVATLMSDSGYVKYKLVAEEWHFFNRNNRQVWVFPKGVFLERYDRNFNIDMHLTADTAYYRDQNLLELRGRVYLHDMEKQVQYFSEELFYDTQKHLFYSSKPLRFKTVDRELYGDRFESDDQFRKYYVEQSRGYLPFSDSGDSKPADNNKRATVANSKSSDSSNVQIVNAPQRMDAIPRARRADLPIPMPSGTMKTDASSADSLR
jgi:LPS export ABC transporter protein LptC